MIESQWSLTPKPTIDGQDLIADASSPTGIAWRGGAQTLTDGANIAWDVRKGAIGKVTLGGNRTLSAPSNIIEGRRYFIVIIQDATGSRTLTWNAAYDFGTTGAPTLTTTASKADLVEFLAVKIGSSTKMRYVTCTKGFG